MHLVSLLVFAAALAGLAWVIRSRGSRRALATDMSPTIMGKPVTTRPLNAGEREAYRILVAAMPDGCLLLSQVALARFIKVSERTSYRAWYDRIGHRCVDFLVCNGDGELVAVVELDEQSNRSPRYQQVVRRKARVLEEASVPVLYWQSADLPSVALARHALEQAAINGGLRARQMMAQPSENPTRPVRKGTMPSPLASEEDEFRKRWSDGSSGTAGRHVGDTVTFGEEGAPPRPRARPASAPHPG